MAHSRLLRHQTYHNNPDELDEMTEGSSSFDYKDPSVQKRKKARRFVWVTLGVVCVMVAITAWSFKNDTSPQVERTYEDLYGFSETVSIGVDDFQSTVGTPAGGDQAQHFRSVIKQGILPLPTDISVTGLLQEYSFTRDDAGTCPVVLCPSYSYAVTRDPFSQSVEYYVSVGLTSEIEPVALQRPQLSLVVVLDISGSMGKPMGIPVTLGTTTDEEKRMTVATQAITELLQKLQPEDMFALVLFDNTAFVEVPLQQVADIEYETISRQIRSITERGGTNISAGYGQGVRILREHVSDNAAHQKRVIVLTDAQPHVGVYARDSLRELIAASAEQGIYTTFMGLNIELNSEFVTFLNQVKGANHVSVHTRDDFLHQFVEMFEYLVTPLLFDVEVEFDSRDFTIVQAYGGGGATAGSLISVSTLFPTPLSLSLPKEEHILLLKLAKGATNSGDVRITVKYTDIMGVRGETAVQLSIAENQPDYFQSQAIRKSVLLVRYGELLIQWLSDEHAAMKSGLFGGIKINNPRVTLGKGIGAHSPSQVNLRKAVETLRVSEPYSRLLPAFTIYMQNEAIFVDDIQLEQELEVLTRLGSV